MKTPEWIPESAKMELREKDKSTLVTVLIDIYEEDRGQAEGGPREGGAGTRSRHLMEHGYLEIPLENLKIQGILF